MDGKTIVDIETNGTANPAGGENPRNFFDKPQAEESKPLASAQFSLRGLMWFTLVCSAYCSLFAVFRDVAVEDHEPTEMSILTVFFAWLVLFIFYLAKGVRGMIVAHCIGPVVALLIAATRSASGNSLLPGSFAVFSPMYFYIHLAAGFFISSMFSFPFTVMRFVTRALWKRYS
jgi:hypothetical protein